MMVKTFKFAVGTKVWVWCYERWHPGVIKQHFTDHDTAVQYGVNWTLDDRRNNCVRDTSGGFCDLALSERRPELGGKDKPTDKPERVEKK